LWKDGLADRVELTPLAAAEVDALLNAVLDGPVDGATVHRLYERSEGNVLFLRELVLSALDTGALRSEGGLWSLVGRLPTSARLVELVEVRLAGLVQGDREVLEVVALGEPLGLDVVSRHGDEASLAGLERRQLVRILE